MHPDGYVLWALFLLAFVRVVGLFVQAPIWGSAHIPKQGLVGAALCITVVLWPTLPVPPAALVPTTIPALFLALLGQLAIGLIIGYASFLVIAAVQFAGELLDIQMGLSVAASFDPASHGAVNLIRRFEFYFAMLVYLMIGGHHTLLRALAQSYQVLPPWGAPHISWALITHLTALTSQMFVLAVQIAAPVLAALFVTQVALGLLARIAPQMNVFMLSFPLNIMVGLSLFSLSLPFIFYALGSHGHLLYHEDTWDLWQIFREMKP